MIESKFVEVTDRDAKNIGVNWSSLQNYNLSVGPRAGNPLGTFDRSRGQTISDGVNGSNGNSLNNNNAVTTNNNTTNTNTQTSGSTQSNNITASNGVTTVTATTGTTGALNNNTTTTNGGGTTGNNNTTATSALNFINSIANTQTRIAPFRACSTQTNSSSC